MASADPAPAAELPQAREGADAGAAPAIPPSPTQEDAPFELGAAIGSEPPVSTCTLIVDSQGVIRFCSSSIDRLAGHRASDWVGRPVTALIPGLRLEEWTPNRDLSSAELASVPVGEQPLVLVAADGSVVPVDVGVRAVELDGARAIALELRRHGATATPSERLRLLAWVAEQSPDAVAITDADGVIRYVNAAFEALTGFSRSEAVGHTHGLLKSGEQASEFYRDLWATIRGGRVFRAVLVNRRKDGALYYEDKTIRPVLGRDGRITHFVATGRDVSEQMRTLGRLQHAATHDPLTDLPNRSLFLDRLGQALKLAARRGEPLVVAVADVDDFKAINDRLGHPLGDAVLQAVAARLRRHVRAADTVARFGGDEFALLLVDVRSARAAAKILDKVVAAFASPVRLDGEPLRVTVSIGACFGPAEGADESQLLGLADKAMYAAKRAGGDRYVLRERRDEASADPPGERGAAAGKRAAP